MILSAKGVLETTSETESKTPRAKALPERDLMSETKSEILEALGEFRNKESTFSEYEKVKFLRNLCDVIAYGKWDFSEEEKNELFECLKNADENGISFWKTGLGDNALAKLVFCAEEGGTKSFLERNAKIAKLAEQLEEKWGFFDETAAKLVGTEPKRAAELAARCLNLWEKNDTSGGLIFVAGLVELNYVRPAVQILVRFAEKGQATESICFLHRLLAKTTGRETAVLDVLRLNLRSLNGKRKFGDTLVFERYVVKRYLSAVRVFAEKRLYKEGCALLKELFDNGWLDINTALAGEFADLANFISGECKEVLPVLRMAAEKFGLEVFEDRRGVLFGRECDTPEVLLRRREDIKYLVCGENDVGDFVYPEIGNVDVVSQKEKAAKTIEKKNSVSETSVLRDESGEVSGVLVAEEGKESASDHSEACSEEAEVRKNAGEEEKKMPDRVFASDIAHENVEKEENRDLTGGNYNEISAQIDKPDVFDDGLPSGAEAENSVVGNKVLFDRDEFAEKQKEVNKEDDVAVFEKVSDEGNNPDGFSDSQVEQEGDAFVSPIEKWEDEGGSGETVPFRKTGNGINVSNILKIDAKEVDRHFEKIKQVASSAFQKAEGRVSDIKERVRETGIANVSSVEKIKGLAKKVNFFKKK